MPNGEEQIDFKVLAKKLDEFEPPDSTVAGPPLIDFKALSSKIEEDDLGIFEAAGKRLTRPLGSIEKFLTGGEKGPRPGMGLLLVGAGRALQFVTSDITGAIAAGVESGGETGAQAIRRGATVSQTRTGDAFTTAWGNNMPLVKAGLISPETGKKIASLGVDILTDFTNFIPVVAITKFLQRGFKLAKAVPAVTKFSKQIDELPVETVVKNVSEEATGKVGDKTAEIETFVMSEEINPITSIVMTGGDFPETPVMSLKLMQKIADKFTEVAIAKGHIHDPKKRISIDEAGKFIADGKITFDDLSKFGVITVDELNNFFMGSMSHAGTTLKIWSQVVQRARKQAQKGSKAAKEFLKGRAERLPHMTPTKPQKFLSLWKGLLVSQMAVGMRNIRSQGMRIGVHTMSKSIQFGLDAITAVGKGDGSKMVHTFGELKDATRLSIDVMMQLGTRGKKGLNKKNVDKVLEIFPEVEKRLLRRFASDVDISGTTLAEKIINKLPGNILNRFQENIFKKAGFFAELSGIARRKGLQLENLIETGNMHLLSRKDIDDALEFGLDIAFAKDATFSLGKIVEQISSNPVLGIVLPFGRWMNNSTRFLYEHSPAGLVKLFKFAGRKGERLNSEELSKIITGTGLMVMGWELRTSDFAGERWFDVDVGKDKNGDSIFIDIRGDAPLASYAFLGDVYKHFDQGTMTQIRAQDILAGIVGANFRAGPAVRSVNEAIAATERVASGQNTQFDVPLTDDMQGIMSVFGEYVASFFTPLQSVKDLVAQFVEEEAIIRDKRTKEGTLGPFTALVGPAAERIPFVSRKVLDLPPVSRLQTGKPLKRELPLVRQLAGLTFKLRTPVQREFDRLGIRGSQLVPPTGNPDFDRETAKAMGPLMDSIIGEAIKKRSYKNKPDSEKNLTIKLLLESARSAAREIAVGKRPKEAIERDLRRKLLRLGIPR